MFEIHDHIYLTHKYLKSCCESVGINAALGLTQVTRGKAMQRKSDPDDVALSLWVPRATRETLKRAAQLRGVTLAGVTRSFLVKIADGLRPQIEGLKAPTVRIGEDQPKATKKGKL